MKEVARRLGHSSERSARFYIDCKNEPTVEEYRAHLMNASSVRSATKVEFIEEVEVASAPRSTKKAAAKKKKAAAKKASPKKAAQKKKATAKEAAAQKKISLRKK